MARRALLIAGMATSVQMATALLYGQRKWAEITQEDLLDGKPKISKAAKALASAVADALAGKATYDIPIPPVASVISNVSSPPTNSTPSVAHAQLGELKEQETQATAAAAVSTAVRQAAQKNLDALNQQMSETQQKEAEAAEAEAGYSKALQITIAAEANEESISAAQAKMDAAYKVLDVQKAAAEQIFAQPQRRLKRRWQRSKLSLKSKLKQRPTEQFRRRMVNTWRPPHKWHRARRWQTLRRAWPSVQKGVRQQLKQLK